MVQTEDRDKINFIFCKPYKEPYYMYYINELDNAHLKTRDDLVTFLSEISQSCKYDFVDITCHFESFIYFVKEKELKVLRIEELSDKEVTAIITEKQNKELKEPKKEKTTYEDLYKSYFNNKEGYFFNKLFNSLRGK